MFRLSTIILIGCAAFLGNGSVSFASAGGKPNPCVEDPATDPGGGAVWVAYPVCEWVTVTITGPSSTQDGASAEFEVTVDPDDLSPTYKWSYTTPSGAGNLPTGNIFDDDTKVDPTVANAWWFASPDNKGTAAPACDYTIKVDVTIDGKLASETANWNVFVTSDSEGRLGWVVRPRITGEPAYELYSSGGNDYYRIASENGSLSRNTPANSDINYGVLDSGQWKNKTKKHEEEHVKQWPSGAWKNFFLVQAFRTRLNNVSTTYAGNSLGLRALELEVKSRISDFNSAETTKANNAGDREALARAAADSEPPLYDFSGQTN